MHSNTVLNDNYGLWQHVWNKYKKSIQFYTMFIMLLLQALHSKAGGTKH